MPSYIVCGRVPTTIDGRPVAPGDELALDTGPARPHVLAGRLRKAADSKPASRRPTASSPSSSDDTTTDTTPET